MALKNKKKKEQELGTKYAGYKKGGKAKKKSKFPDHSGDGKITKKSCTGRAKALAKTFKKMAKKRKK